MRQLVQTQTFVTVRTSFEARHRWPNAPENVAFLRNSHRHIFHVALSIEVFEDDREIEYFTLLGELEKHIRMVWLNTDTTASCEMMAKDILAWCKEEYSNRSIQSVVSEDGENEAEVNYWINGAWKEIEISVAIDEINKGDNKEGNYVNMIERLNKEKESFGRNKVQTECYVGYEATGPQYMRGRPTFFVPGSITPSEFYQQLAIAGIKWDSAIRGCYYGAGYDNTFRQDTWDAICKVFPHDKIIREYKIPDTDHSRVYVGLYDYLKTFAKIVSDKGILWSNPREQHFTDINDPKFAQDIPVSKL